VLADDSATPAVIIDRPSDPTRRDSEVAPTTLAADGVAPPRDAVGVVFATRADRARTVDATPLAASPPAPDALPPADAFRTDETPTGEARTPEARTPGSALVLPANPLQDLTDESIEGFVDCTLYEESGN